MHKALRARCFSCSSRGFVRSHVSYAQKLPCRPYLVSKSFCFIFHHRPRSATVASRLASKLKFVIRLLRTCILALDGVFSGTTCGRKQLVGCCTLGCNYDFAAKNADVLFLLCLSSALLPDFLEAWSGEGTRSSSSKIVSLGPKTGVGCRI